MKATQFIQQWYLECSNKMILYPISLLEQNNIQNQYKIDLSEIGLPHHAAPFLTFEIHEKIDKKIQAILNDWNYFWIGSTIDNDLICIEKENGKIITLSHEEPKVVWSFNSSLSALYQSILCYQRFIKEVQSKTGNCSFLKNHIPSDTLNKLGVDLKNIDTKAFEEEGFWAEQVEFFYR